MPSDASFRGVGAVTIVDLSGVLRLGESSNVLRRVINDLIAKQRHRIVLNFRNVSEIDSAGVGELIAAYTALKNNHGRLKLLNPPKKVCDVLELTKLSKVVEVYTKEESALDSFE